MDIATAYQSTWSFVLPRKCQEMHAAGLFEPRGPHALRLAVFDMYDGAAIADGDVYVAEDLIAGLVPIGGDRTGDRWCFDTRLRVGGTIPVVHCPHDGGGATYVAPSFAAFVYRLVLYNLVVDHIFKSDGVDREGLRRLTRENLERIDRWMLRRWQRRAHDMLEGIWPRYEALDEWLRGDPAFARLPAAEFDHFRPRGT